MTNHNPQPPTHHLPCLWRVLVDRSYGWGVFLFAVGTHTWLSAAHKVCARVDAKQFLICLYHTNTRWTCVTGCCAAPSARGPAGQVPPELSRCNLIWQIPSKLEPRKSIKQAIDNRVMEPPFSPPPPPPPSSPTTPG